MYTCTARRDREAPLIDDVTGEDGFDHANSSSTQSSSRPASDGHRTITPSRGNREEGEDTADEDDYTATATRQTQKRSREQEDREDEDGDQDPTKRRKASNHMTVMSIGLTATKNKLTPSHHRIDTSLACLGSDSVSLMCPHKILMRNCCKACKRFA